MTRLPYIGKENKRRMHSNNTKSTLGVTIYLHNFSTTVVAPYWINQLFQSRMYNQTQCTHKTLSINLCFVYYY